MPSYKIHKKNIEKMYSNFNFSKPDIDLMHTYFRAMSNFYETISLSQIYEIIDSQNGGRIASEDFINFAEIVRHEQHFYYILGAG